MRHKLYSFDLLTQQELKNISEIELPDENALQKRQKLLRCLTDTAKTVLTPRQQEIIFRIMAGEKQVEIAADLGLSKSSVSRTYHRGMEKLSEHTKYLGMFLR